MGLREELIAELESTRREYQILVESIPERTYGYPSANPAWTIGDVLYHITLGPPAIRAEIWMIRHAGWLFSSLLNNRTAGLLNRGNALLARHPKRITSRTLIKSYEKGHSGLLTSLRGMQDTDFYRSILYPGSFVPELDGVVTVERLLRYIKLHFEVHAGQIRQNLG
jgi:hypothetical protein